MKEPSPGLAIDASAGLALGLTLMGAWFFAQGAMDTVDWLAIIVRTQQNLRLADPGTFAWTPEQIGSMVSTGFELAVGAFLLFGNAGLRRLIQRVKYAGT
jgi:hypothetical protein